MQRLKVRDQLLSFPIALKFDKFIDSTAAEAPTKFQSDPSFSKPSLMGSRLCNILQ